jgi:adenosylhomocysteine nucleosidase
MMRVVMLAALPQESRPLLKLLGESHRLAGEPFPTWIQRCSLVELLLVETGMGRERAGRAARHVLSAFRIDLLVSVGFAGSLWPDFRLGQAVWARELAVYDTSCESAPSGGFRPASILALTAFCRIHNVRPARFLTVDRVLSKAGMTGRFAEDPAVVEMESTAVAAAGHRPPGPRVGPAHHQ